MPVWTNRPLSCQALLLLELRRLGQWVRSCLSGPSIWSPRCFSFLQHLYRLRTMLSLQTFLSNALAQFSINSRGAVAYEKWKFDCWTLISETRRCFPLKPISYWSKFNRSLLTSPLKSSSTYFRSYSVSTIVGALNLTKIMSYLNI